MPRRILQIAAVLVLVVAGMVLPATSSARADQSTVAYDLLRTGWDPNEPALTSGSVTASDFGQLWSRTLPRSSGDATTDPNQLYAQPLVADGYVIVATEENQVDALDPKTGQLRWTHNLGPAWTPPGCGDLVPHIGITSTPVYDPSTKSVYVVTKTDDGSDSDHPHLRLHSLDVTTGAERTGWPVEIAGQASNSTEVLNPSTANQRPGLLLLNGSVYIGTASNCDRGPYVGYLVGINTTSRAVQLWSTEDGSTSDGAGIWQSGGAPMSDGTGRIFIATGNGVSPAPGPGSTPPGTLAESVVRLAVGSNGALTAKDYFSPANNAHLDSDDADLGSGSPVGLPDSFGTPSHPHLLVIAGKDGTVRLLDRDDLGGTAQGPGGTDKVLSSLQFSGVWGRAAVFDASSSAGTRHLVYLLPRGGPMHALQIAPDADGVPTLTDVTTTSASFGYTSGSPVVTSTGTDPSSALVWLVTCNNASGANGMLRAFPAIPPSSGAWHPIFQAPLGTIAKFLTPATDSGRIYVGTRDGRVLAFGAPTTATITSPSTDLGVVEVDDSVTKNVVLTAHADTTITAVSANGPFVATPPALPATVEQGGTTTVPVTFHPTTAGDADGLLTVTVQGINGPQQFVFSLSGIGAQDGLAAGPAALDFGAVPVGQSGQLGILIRNTGTTATTITGYSVPTSGPFSVRGLPAVGTDLGAQQSVSATVSFTPTATGAATGTFSVTGSKGGARGHVSVALRGSGQSGAPRLTLRPARLDFGNVAPGASRTRSFTLTNTGTTSLTVNKAPPPNAPFTVARPIGEGQRLAPGDSIRTSVTFTPTTAHRVTDRYLISGSDGTGAHSVALVGNAQPWTGQVRTSSGCLAARARHPKSGTGLRVVSCTRPIAGRFTRTAHGALRLGSATSHWCVSASDRTAGRLRHCNATAAQSWSWSTSNRLVNRAHGQCLQASPQLTAVARCASTGSQAWNLSALYAHRGLISVGAAAVNQVCLDTRRSATGATPHPARLQTCATRSSQIATVVDSVIRVQARCLGATGTTAGALVATAACTGRPAQRWVARANGTLRNPQAGLCLTDPHNATVAGTALHLGRCTGARGQVWHLP